MEINNNNTPDNIVTLPDGINVPKYVAELLISSADDPNYQDITKMPVYGLKIENNERYDKI